MSSYNNNNNNNQDDIYSYIMAPDVASDSYIRREIALIIVMLVIICISGLYKLSNSSVNILSSPGCSLDFQ